MNLCICIEHRNVADSHKSKYKSKFNLCKLLGKIKGIKFQTGPGNPMRRLPHIVYAMLVEQAVCGVSEHIIMATMRLEGLPRFYHFRHENRHGLNPYK